ncbi:porin [Photobacterium sp. ZSDE20]|uniref:Porin n=1 Tax=Photobacterium pectinilyticum TaxID=2906793 RepID=A0ABT1MXP2_9GAMM|nr:porin [Photobacterium sp. ZSDE20]MCQ1056607.1 porin [Photobacterium sp. ZSDE20]MDD1820742.1 porin [Photobacterium sp. ZSDE20]
MKKTLLALAVLAAGSAQAGINLYDANGVLVDLTGAAEVQFMQGYAQDSNAELRLDDGDLQLNTTIALSNQLNAVAGIGFSFDDNADSKVSNDKLFVGLGGDFGTLTFGRQLLIADDSGIGKDYELGGDGLDFVQAEGNRAIKYVFDNGQFYAGISGIVGEDNDSDTTDTDIIDGRLGARFGDFDARVYLYSGSDVKGSFTSFFGDGSVLDIDGYNLEAEYYMGAIALSASFGQVEYEDNTGKVEADTAALAGSYTMDKTTFALGYTYLNADFKSTAGGKDSEDANTFYANVTEQLHSNVKAYAEIGYTDVDDAEFGYVVGMEVIF